MVCLSWIIWDIVAEKMPDIEHVDIVVCYIITDRDAFISPAVIKK